MVGEVPQSPYRQKSWTVTQLKEELKQRNLSPFGTKTELITRLEKDDSAGNATPRKKRGRPSAVMYMIILCCFLRTPTIKQKKLEGQSAVELANPFTESSKETRGRPSRLNMSPEKVARKVSISPKRSLSRTSRVSRSSSSSGRSSRSPSKSKSPPRSVSKSSRGRKFKEYSNTLLEENLGSSRTKAARKDFSKAAAAATKQLSLLHNPLTTLNFFLLAVCGYFQHCVSKIQRRPIWWSIGFVFSIFILGLSIIDGSHQVWFKPVKNLILWYSHWIFLGFLSSFGLGLGAHTFLLFLGPMISRATTAAYICKTTAFTLRGVEKMTCPSGSYIKGDVTILQVFTKVFPEVFSWGLGTALGELFPYLVALATAKTVGKSERLHQMNELAAKKHRTFFDNASLLTFELINALGFWGILFCASFPNPFFDIAGLTCGYFLIPFSTFFAATFIGKTLIKANIQSLFVIFLFSKDYLERAISFVQKKFPAAGGPFHKWLLYRRSLFQQAQTTSGFDIGTFWHVVIYVATIYFIGSLIQTVANMQANKSRSKKSI